MLNILMWYAYAKMHMAITGIIGPWVSQLAALVRPPFNSSTHDVLVKL